MNVDVSDVKSYWNSRPCNIRHSNLPVGSREYFDSVEQRKYLVEPHIPDFASFPRWEGKRVLEIGCGIGTDAINFARHGAEYVGVELSEVSLELTRKRFEEFGLDADFHVANVEELDNSAVPKGPYDLIYSFGVLHHTPNPQKALEVLRQFAGPNTELRIMLYAKHSWKAMLISAGLDQPEAQDGCPIALTFSQEQARDLLESSGFVVEDIWQDHVFSYRIEDYVNYRYVKEPWFEAMPDQHSQALERYLGWHTLIVAKPA